MKFDPSFPYPFRQAEEPADEWPDWWHESLEEWPYCVTGTISRGSLQWPGHPQMSVHLLLQRNGGTGFYFIDEEVESVVVHAAFKDANDAMMFKLMFG